MNKFIILLLSCLTAFETATSQSSYLHPAANSAFHLSNVSGRQQEQYHEINWQVYNEIPGDYYFVERRLSQNEPFKEVSRLIVSSTNPFNSYTIKIPAIASGETFYRIVSARRNAGTTYSNIITVGNRGESRFRAFVSGSNLFVTLPEDSRSISFFNTDGKLVSQETVTGGQSLTSYSLSSFSRGMIVVSVQTQRGRLVTKVVH